MEKSKKNNENLNKISKQSKDIPIFPAFATNSLIMVESELTGKIVLDEEQVIQAQTDVEENHK